jgi:acyl-[acyl carrier protein]--UDP-N-acetylglucosamine O-acyltransferase
VVLIGGAKCANIFYIVGSSATIAGGSHIVGNVLAYTSIAVGAAASINGTLGALNGAVTLIDDAIETCIACRC